MYKIFEYFSNNWLLTTAAYATCLLIVKGIPTKYSSIKKTLLLVVLPIEVGQPTLPVFIQ
ncbi:hypothetical protein [Emticicia sp.]|uniref:hypothetical protein n=1 Tax=Emticicia sp. TaxID=1930953 RepID=UPI00374FE288